MKPAPRARQRGVALLAMVAIAVVAVAYLLVSHLNAASGFRAVNATHNAKVLNQAKQALIGYVAQQAALPGENNPGRLPCPEAPGNFGTSNEGIAAGNCTLPAVGRLPWRTLGLDNLVDASSESLWYVVSPAWALSNSTTPPLTTFINSNSRGQLTVDGAPNDAVALIIAPGPAMAAPADVGCTAWNQVRPTTGAPDLRNYLECQNAAGPNFVTTGPSGAFNDQLVRVTVADVMPAIEAAIAVRIEREIVPQLRGVYGVHPSGNWAANVSAANPLYPFAAPFADPSAATAYRGSATSCVSNVCEGLLPVIFNNAPGSTTTLCTLADSPLCDPTFVRWSDTGSSIRVTSFNLALTLPIVGPVNLANITPNTNFLAGILGWNPNPAGTTCSANMTNSPHTLDCPLRVPGLTLGLTTQINYEITGAVSNVAMAMRQFNATASLGTITTTAAPTIAMNSTGSATITVRGREAAPAGTFSLDTTLCGLDILGPILPVVSALIGSPGCSTQMLSVPMTLLPDHAILNSSNPTTGWFMRNRWYEVMYYAAAQSVTPAALPVGVAGPGCDPVGPPITCLSVDNLAAPSNNKRAVLVLAGRSRLGTVGANRALADFLDTAENRSANRVFEKLPVNSTSNDRFVVVQGN